MSKTTKTTFIVLPIIVLIILILVFVIKSTKGSVTQCPRDRSTRIEAQDNRLYVYPDRKEFVIDYRCLTCGNLWAATNITEIKK